MKVHVNRVFLCVSEALVKFDLRWGGRFDIAVPDLRKGVACDARPNPKHAEASSPLSLSTLGHSREPQAAPLRALGISTCGVMRPAARGGIASPGPFLRVRGSSSLRIRLLLLRKSFNSSRCNLGRGPFNIFKRRRRVADEHGDSDMLTLRCREDAHIIDGRPYA
jgi:hypothetical protein